MPKVMIEKRDKAQAFKKGRHESYQELIDRYTRASNSQARNNLKRRVSSYRNQDEIVRYLKGRIGNASKERKYLLLQLGLYLNRKQFLYVFLDTIQETGHVIDDVSLLNQFNSKPLDQEERGELARYIAENPDFDKRLLPYLDERSLEFALKGILKNAKENGLTSKQLQALVLIPSLLDQLQVELRTEIAANPTKRKNWLRFLNIADISNQEFFVKGYSFRDIYEQLSSRDFAYVESEYFEIRVAQKLIHGMEMDSDDWNELRAIIVRDVTEVGDIESNRGLLRLLKDVSRYEYGFSEAMLIKLHKKSAMYTGIVIDTLAELGSQYAYREMINTLISTEDSVERYRSAINLIRMYPDKAPIIIRYTEDLGDRTLISKVKIEAAKIEDKGKIANPIEKEVQQQNGFQVISHEVEIHELLYRLAEKINATEFYAAVGFVFGSGLQLLKPVLDLINEKNGSIELIIGSLQRYRGKEINRKIDRKTVCQINRLIDDCGTKVFTYENSFFHGKFYYIGNHEKAYVIMGSTNISKTALLDNYEIDTMFEIDLKKDRAALSWYEQFRKQCIFFDRLDESLFIDFNWNSELDVYGERILRRMTPEEVQQRISEVGDEETRFRLETWMEHKPSDRFDNLGIPALKDYVAFVFEEYSLAVFESFEPMQAYYTFRCSDFSKLLELVGNMSKREMALSSDYLKKGYHIQDRDRLREKIEKLFIRA